MKSNPNDYDEIRELLPRKYQGMAWSFPPESNIGNSFMAVGRSRGSFLKLSIQNHAAQGFYCILDAGTQRIAATLADDPTSFEQAIAPINDALTELHTATVIREEP